MRYSELPPEAYVKEVEAVKGFGLVNIGPGASLIGDVEKWNWRYLIAGLRPDPVLDLCVDRHFHEWQRELMRLPPMEAIERMADQEWSEGDVYFLDETAFRRAEEAQVRLFPKATCRENNVIHANFRKK
jgi:hypothetical protein